MLGDKVLASAVVLALGVLFGIMFTVALGFLSHASGVGNVVKMLELVPPEWRPPVHALPFPSYYLMVPLSLRLALNIAAGTAIAYLIHTFHPLIPSTGGNDLENCKNNRDNEP